MRRACISLGQIECDDCHRTVPYPQRYLIIDEAEDNQQHLCKDCALKKGYAHYRSEKGGMTLTFFEELESTLEEE